MIIHVENPMKTTKKILELSEFSKVIGYKFNIPKSIVFLYICNEQSENEIKKTIPLTIASKRIKYIRINSTKEMQNLSLKAIKYC